MLSRMCLNKTPAMRNASSFLAERSHGIGTFLPGHLVSGPNRLHRWIDERSRIDISWLLSISSSELKLVGQTGWEACGRNSAFPHWLNYNYKGEKHFRESRGSSRVFLILISNLWSELFIKLYTSGIENGERTLPLGRRQQLIPLSVKGVFQ